MFIPISQYRHRMRVTTALGKVNYVKTMNQTLRIPFEVCNSEPHAEFMSPLQHKPNLITGPMVDVLTHIPKDSFHTQCALLKEMGLSCENQDSKVEELLLSMEWRELLYGW